MTQTQIDMLMDELKREREAVYYTTGIEDGRAGVLLVAGRGVRS